MVSVDSFCPDYMGTEEETRISFYDSTSSSYRKLEESEFLTINSLMNIGCPPIWGSSKDYFRQNGGRTYYDTKSLELATPEVSGPYALAAYIKAYHKLFVNALGEYVINKSKSERHERTLLFNRRVIDTNNNTWGCHDNFSVPSSGYPQLSEGHTMRLWKTFLSSRNFITGSLLVGQDNCTFSQKLSVHHEDCRYGFYNSLLRYEQQDKRLEIRCNDINLNDWAVAMRAGGAALVLAASQTLLGEELANSKPYSNWIEDLSNNYVPLTDDGELISSDSLKRNIDIQRYTITKILENLDLESYVRMGKDILKYCDDLEMVTSGKADLSLLVDRSDWASKLYAIRRKLNGGKICNSESRILDLVYGQIELSANPNGNLQVKHGYGYALAERSSFLSGKDELIDHAMTTPPKGRATARVKVAKRLPKSGATLDWSHFTITNSKTVKFSIPDDPSHFSVLSPSIPSPATV